MRGRRLGAQEQPDPLLPPFTPELPDLTLHLIPSYQRGLGPQISDVSEGP